MGGGVSLERVVLLGWQEATPPGGACSPGARELHASRRGRAQGLARAEDSWGKNENDQRGVRSARRDASGLGVGTSEGTSEEESHHAGHRAG